MPRVRRLLPSHDQVQSLEAFVSSENRHATPFTHDAGAVLGAWIERASGLPATVLSGCIALLH